MFNRIYSWSGAWALSFTQNSWLVHNLLLLVSCMRSQPVVHTRSQSMQSRHVRGHLPGPHSQHSTPSKTLTLAPSHNDLHKIVLSNMLSSLPACIISRCGVRGKIYCSLSPMKQSPATSKPTFPVARFVPLYIEEGSAISRTRSRRLGRRNGGRERIATLLDYTHSGYFSIDHSREWSKYSRSES